MMGPVVPVPPLPPSEMIFLSQQNTNLLIQVAKDANPKNQHAINLF